MMLQTEYVRSLNCNYERLLLEEKPEEKRYQYCILGRGGIKGLLSCSLRYINGQAYLYYDISSRQSITQLYGSRQITRGWMRDFVWSLKKLQQELERFLLDMRNVVWYPQHIFQDLESNVFSFLYVPYYKGELSFLKLVEFWVERIDYDDEELVNYVYRVYEHVERKGEDYLCAQLYEDAACLEKAHVREEPRRAGQSKAAEGDAGGQEGGAADSSCSEDMLLSAEGEDSRQKEQKDLKEQKALKEQKGLDDQTALKDQKALKEEKKGIRGILEGRKSKNKKLREEYRQAMQQKMTSYAAEETPYEEEYGRTIFVEEKEEEPQIHRLFSGEGKVLAGIERPILTIGKKRGEVDVVLEDASVSRIHARITMEKENFYLEDLNSTNGTFKNGLRLQPYEKRKLEKDDEIRCGKVEVVFR